MESQVPRVAEADVFALAKTDEERSEQAPTLDPDFAVDVQEIVSNRKPRTRQT